MQITMGIVGQPNVTVTTSATAAEMCEYEAKAEDTKSKGKKSRPMDREGFDDARRRFAKQGATEVRYFLA